MLDYIRRSGCVSIGGIAKDAGISIPTSQKIVDLFLSAGLVTPAGKGSSTDDGGKKPSLYKLNPRFGVAISIHFWPDRMSAAATDLRSTMLAHEESPVEKSSSMADAARMAADAIRRLSNSPQARGVPLVGVAVALPGITNSRNGVSVFSPHYPGWEPDFPIGEEIARRAGISAPIYVDNVNRYQAFAEGQMGLAAGKKSFLIVDALAEGLGAGIITDGRMVHGTHELAGEIGHMILQPDGYPCICGAQGCFEAMVSVRRLLDNAEAARASHPDSVLAARPLAEGDGVRRIFDAFASGDSLARELIDDVIRWFALGLNNVLMVFDPEIIILQGIYTSIGAYFLRELRARMRSLALPAIDRDVRIECSAFGPERGIVGGSLVVCQDYFARRVWKDLAAFES